MPQPDIDLHDLYELKLMEHVEETPRLSNRQASSILGVSIKLAHDVLGRMVTKGMFHVHKHHARRWDYFLTPKGITEKARLTMEFLDFSMHFYREARKLSAQLCRDLSESGSKTVAFLGSDNLAEITYLGVQEWGLTLTAVYDDAEPDAGATFMKVPIQSAAELPADTADAIIVCTYDATHPMRHHYLPDGIDAKDNMHWIFSQADQAP